MHVTIREPGYLAARARSPPIGAYARRKEARVFSSLSAGLFLAISLALSQGPQPTARGPQPTARGPQPTARQASAVQGVVVDTSGRPVPRALVQVVTRDGATAASIFTEADGSFRVAATPAGCRLQASLTGFRPASADCRTEASVKLTLGIAPVAESIVVSATRTEAPAGQVASAITVFDAAEIERKQEPPLGDLLRGAPGTTVVRSGAPGAVTSLFVRAGESNYTKVLLDGIPLNEPGGAFNLSNITTENLDRVEFVRGANSAIYGSDAMTGVIQLLTRRGEQARPDVRLGFEGGTFSTARGSAGVAGKAGLFDYSAGVAGLTTDNDAPNNKFRNATLSGSAGAALAHGATLRFVGRAERGNTGTPGQIAFGRPDLDAFYTRHDGVWGTAFDQNAGAFHQHAAYGLAISHQASTNLHLDPPYTPTFEGRIAPFEFTDFAYDSRTDLRRHHASYQADMTIPTASAGTHVETALVDWDGEHGTLRDALAGTSVPASRDNVGVTLQHQALWSRAFVTAGVRFEHNASFGNATVPRVAVAWYARTEGDAIGATRISASAGRGIKEPTILQSFSPNPFFMGNPDLEPERARAIEVGVEQRLAKDRLRVDASWFDNRYRNIIATRTISFSPFVSQYFNIGLTRARGAEISADVVLVSGFRAKTGYTFTDSEILESTSTSPVFKAGNWAFRRPRHSGFVDLAWSGARASADLSGSLSGRRVDSDFSSLVPPIVSNDGYGQWDLRGIVRLTHTLSLTGAIDNLTDSTRMEPLGYPVLGRAIRFGVRARF
jgi:outer membrane cobalamin receptor